MEKAIIKKMRLQLYDSEFNQLSDKLVAQDTELYKGPEETHIGPIRVEFCLFEKEDVDKCILYLQKISGNIPLNTKVKKVQKPDSEDALSNEDLEVVQKLETQDAIIRYLRDHGFVFLTTEQASDYGLFTADESVANYQWMLKLIKEAKDPKNNKYDLTLKFGFKIIGEKTNDVVVVNFATFKVIQVPWKNPNRPINYKKLDLTKFPVYMVSNERMKFSKELAGYRRAKEADPEFKADSAFFTRTFLRWAPFVEFKEKEELTPLFT